MKRCLAWMYHDLLQFNKRVLKLFETPGYKKTLAVNWKDYSDTGEFQMILRAFKHHKRLLEKLLDDHHRQNRCDADRQLNNHIVRYQDDREALLRHIEVYEQDRRDQLSQAKKDEIHRTHAQYLSVIRWLESPGDKQPEVASQNEFRKIRSEHPDTGQWILQENKFYNWLNGEPPTHSTLWMNGKKGAG